MKTFREFGGTPPKQIEEMAIIIGKNLAIAIVNAAKAIKILTQNFRELTDVLGILLVAFGGTIKIIIGTALILNNLNKRIRDLLGTAKEVVNPFEETRQIVEEIAESQNKITKEAPVGFSWTTLVFSFLVPLTRNDWKYALIMLAAVPCTLGISVYQGSASSQFSKVSFYSQLVSV